MENTKLYERNFPECKLYPWTESKAKFTKVQLEKNKTKYTKQELKRLTTEKIEEINADFQIYTDGSTSKNQENGGAGIVILNKEGDIVYQNSKPAGSLCSSLDAESLALLDAVQWIKQKEQIFDYAQFKSSAISLVCNVQG